MVAMLLSRTYYCIDFITNPAACQLILALQDESLTDKAKSALETAKHAVRWAEALLMWGGT